MSYFPAAKQVGKLLKVDVNHAQLSPTSPNPTDKLVPQCKHIGCRLHIGCWCTGWMDLGLHLQWHFHGLNCLRWVSSAYWMWETIKFYILTIAACSNPSEMACFVNKLRPSVAIRKRNGDKGSPCLTPRFSKNSPDGLPFTRAFAVAVERQVFIHSIHFLGKFILLSNPGDIASLLSRRLWQNPL